MRGKKLFNLQVILHLFDDHLTAILTHNDLTGYSMPTVNEVVKEFINFGDFVDENGPRMTKNAYEKLSKVEQDAFRRVVRFLITYLQSPKSKQFFIICIDSQFA